MAQDNGAAADYGKRIATPVRRVQEQLAPTNLLTDTIDGAIPEVPEQTVTATPDVPDGIAAGDTPITPSGSTRAPWDFTPVSPTEYSSALSKANIGTAVGALGNISNSDFGGKVKAYAEQFLGTPYVWGGTQPGGFDCSGLVQYVYKKMGIDLPRISAAQANGGKRVGLDALQAGDLVAWDNSSRNNGADHIAIYIGGGQIIEAPRPGLAVRVRKLGANEGAWGVRYQTEGGVNA